MEQEHATIADVPVDVMQCIMGFVAKGDDGASNLAKAIAVCKAFKQFSNDEEILKVTNFENMEQHFLNVSLWNNDGLLTKCASVGNKGAHEIMQQIQAILLAMGE